MLEYVVRRLLYTVPVLFGASVVIFLLIHLVPGDPAAVIAGPEASIEQIEAIRERLELNEPLYVQYITYMANVFQADFGESFYYNEDISMMIANTMPATLQLSFAALVIALSVAIPLGVISATRRNSVIDYGSMIAAVVGISIPVFWLGIMLIFVFAVQLNWLPASGRGENPWSVDGFKHLILPAISLGSIMMASTTRLTRGAMLEVLQEDYVRTARAKGLRARVVVYRHALRNALIPVVTNVGLQIGNLLAGAFLVEVVFAWPGIGRLSVDAMFRRDYPLVQATILMAVFFFIMVNLIVDLLYPLIDPRIKYR